MSRSIHTTRRQLKEEKQADYADVKKRAQHIAELQDEIARKQRIKAQIQEEHHAPVLPLPPFEPEEVPIIVEDEDEHVHYPASADDIRNVIRLMPRGSLDGIDSIVLCLGSGFQVRPNNRKFRGTEADPFTGRQGNESLPGVFMGRSLGIYSLDRRQIRVFAHVYDSEMPERAMWELYLRLHMLSTFVHEAAHHHDNTMRVTRGRWLTDSGEKLEIYAEKNQHEWTQNCIIPYLQQTYAEQCQTLEEWVEHFGGVFLPLSTLAGDSRSTLKGGHIAVKDGIFTIFAAINRLASDVAEGKELNVTRLNFANELHYTTRYEEPLKIIDRVLGDDPENVTALTLKADIYAHQKRFQEALPFAQQAVKREPTSLPALTVLANIYEDTQEWQQLLTVSTRLIKLSKSPDNLWDRRRGLENRARALLELGYYARLKADLDRLSQFPGITLARRVMRLRAEMEERQKSKRKRA